MHRISWSDFRLVLSGALALLLLVALGERVSFLQPLRLLLGVVYVLYVPGYCLVAAFFARADDLDGIERLGLSIGLSIAIVPVLALMLDWLPWGVHLWPILLGEYSVTALFIVVALWRRSRLPEEAIYVPELTWRSRTWWGLLPSTGRRIYMLLMGALLLASLSAAWIFLLPSSDQFMTEFYILGQNGLAEDYPRQAARGSELAVTLGIVNRERAERTYRVEIWVVDGWDLDRREMVKQVVPISLPTGEGHRWPVSWRMPWSGEDQMVEFLLFVDNDPNSYRQLRLWLDVLPPSADRGGT